MGFALGRLFQQKTKNHKCLFSLYKDEALHQADSLENCQILLHFCQLVNSSNGQGKHWVGHAHKRGNSKTGVTRGLAKVFWFMFLFHFKVAEGEEKLVLPAGRDKSWGPHAQQKSMVLFSLCLSSQSSRTNISRGEHSQTQRVLKKKKRKKKKIGVANKKCNKKDQRKRKTCR